MPIEITVPRLGWSMEEGIFSAWLKSLSRVPKIFLFTKTSVASPRRWVA